MGEADAAGAQGRVWFVQAAGKIWGPYPQMRIEAFVAEGRVAAETLLAPNAEGPFHPAARHAGLHRLFDEEALPPEEAPYVPGAAAAPSHVPAPARALLIWVALKSQRAERFEQAIAAQGPFLRVGVDLWLVRTRLSPPALRNVLTRRLEALDVLIVLEAPLDQAAWFNLDGETDRTLRQLWAG